MREILFRGKRVDNGEWVEGSYIDANRHWHNRGIHRAWICTCAFSNGGWFALGRKYPVDPTTVGQYTGIKDRNQKRIFEGDILADSWGDPLETHTAKVIWEDGGFYADGEYGVTISEFPEVIGTIYDEGAINEPSMP